MPSERHRPCAAPAPPSVPPPQPHSTRPWPWLLSQPAMGPPSRNVGGDMWSRGAQSKRVHPRSEPHGCVGCMMRTHAPQHPGCPLLPRRPGSPCDTGCPQAAQRLQASSAFRARVVSEPTSPWGQLAAPGPSPWLWALAEHGSHALGGPATHPWMPRAPCPARPQLASTKQGLWAEETQFLLRICLTRHPPRPSFSSKGTDSGLGGRRVGRWRGPGVRNSAGSRGAGVWGVPHAAPPPPIALWQVSA